MPSTIKNDEWDLPRLKASIGFEVSLRQRTDKISFTNWLIMCQDDFQYLSSDDQDTGKTG
jgi:polycomb protein EED